MLQDIVQLGGRPATESSGFHPHAGQPFASRLILPRINAPRQFSHHSRSDRLTAVATQMARRGWLTREHWRGDIRNAVTAAFTDLARRELPKPLATYSIIITENLHGRCVYSEGPRYQEEHKLDTETIVSGIVFHFLPDDLVHRCIGPAIQRLEKRRDGLGRTVLYWLNHAFESCARSLNPLTAHEWASYCYWMGESDESLRLEEEIGDFKKGEEAQREAAMAQIRQDMFTRDKLETELPAQYSRLLTKPPLTLRQAVRTLHEHRLSSVELEAAAAIPRETKPRDLNDLYSFDWCHHQVMPYLIRWQVNSDRTSQDRLAQIYDDTMNDMMQCGETQMDVNAIFAWHDESTFVDAVQRFTVYLRRIRIAENLLNRLAPRDA